MVLNNGQTLYSIPPPGSGIILGKSIAIVFHVYFLFATIASSLRSYSIFVVSYQNQNVLQGFILNVMENYKVEPKDFNSPLMYHRLIESFKYGYAYRSQIGDPGDKNITRVVSEVKFFHIIECIQQNTT